MLDADEREARLPAWARDRLRDLRAEVKGLRTQLEGIDSSEAVAWASPYLHPRPVAKDREVVRFGNPAHGESYFDVRLRTETGALEVRSGWVGLAVIPAATNSLFIHHAKEESGRAKSL